jgi:hypothetical protein
VWALLQGKHLDQDCEVGALAILAHSHLDLVTTLDVKVAMSLVLPEFPNVHMTHFEKGFGCGVCDRWWFKMGCGAVIR